MKALAQRSPVHFGWVIAGFAIVCNAVSGAAMFWAVGLYVPAIADDFGVRRTPVVTLFMLGQGVTSLVGPFIGRYIDRHGARGAMLAGAILVPGSIAATAFSTNLWQLGAGWLAVGLFRGLTQPIPFNWVMTRWFEGRRRQSSLGVVTIGYGLGGAAVLPILARVQSATDWSTAMLTSGAILFVIFGFTALVIVRDRPAEFGLEPSIDPRDATVTRVSADDEWGFTSVEALRLPVFWLLSISFTLFFMGQASVTNLGIDFFHSRGVAAGATIFAWSALLRTFARLPIGLALNRFTSPYLLGTVVSVSQGVALAALLANTDTAGIVIFVLMWGTGGAFGPMLEPLFISHVFGVRHFGAVSGIVAMVAFAGQILGSIGGAALYDATGSYAVPYWIYTVGFMVAALLIVGVRMAEQRPAHQRRLAHARAEASRRATRSSPGAAAG